MHSKSRDSFSLFALMFSPSELRMVCIWVQLWDQVYLIWLHLHNLGCTCVPLDPLIYVQYIDRCIWRDFWVQFTRVSCQVQVPKKSIIILYYFKYFSENENKSIKTNFPKVCTSYWNKSQFTYPHLPSDPHLPGLTCIWT